MLAERVRHLRCEGRAEMAQDKNVGERELFRRFWAAASGFWKGETTGASWALTAGLIALALAQLAVQYRLNYWNRDRGNDRHRPQIAGDHPERKSGRSRDAGCRHQNPPIR